MPYEYIDGKPVYYRAGTPLPSKGGLPKKQRETSEQTYTPSKEQKRILQRTEQGLGPLWADAQLRNLYADPTANPAFQKFIGGILDALAPSEEAARRQLEDTFRQSGAIGSGAQAVAARQLEGDILGRRGQTVAQNAGDWYSRLVQSLGTSGQLEQAPHQLGANLLATLRNYGTINQEAEGFAPQQFSGFGGGFSSGGGGGGGSIFGGGFPVAPTGDDIYFAGSPFGSSPPNQAAATSSGSRGLPYPNIPNTGYDYNYKPTPYVNFGYKPQPYNITNVNPNGMWTNY